MKKVDRKQTGLTFLNPRQFKIRVTRNRQILVFIANDVVLALSEAYIATCLASAEDKKAS